MYEYGNTRVAALRSRLLTGADLHRLAEAGSPTALLAQLSMHDDWRRAVVEVEALAGGPGAAVDAAVDRHRAQRLRALPGWYPEPASRLVAALVLPLDLERLLSIARLQRAGEPADAIVARISPGALLDAAAIGRLARARSFAELVAIADGAGVLNLEASGRRCGPFVAHALAATPAVPGGKADGVRDEAWLVEAATRRRRELAGGRGPNAALVRSLIDREVGATSDTWRLAQEAGIRIAASADRSTRLRRLDTVAALGRHDPTGIGTAAGYVAAVEAQGIRVRAALAATTGGWRGRVGEYLAATPIASAAVVRAAAGSTW